jgi:hypothetical protein
LILRSSCVFRAGLFHLLAKVWCLAAADSRESWDLSGLSPPAAAAVLGSRLLWSARAASKDASNDIGNKVTQSLNSLGSTDEDEYYMNPNDPTRVS